MTQAQTGFRAVVRARRQQAELEDLVARAVRNAGVLGPTRPRWAAVSEVFAVGSTRASQLCTDHDLSPDELVGEDEHPEWL